MLEQTSGYKGNLINLNNTSNIYLDFIFEKKNYSDMLIVSLLNMSALSKCK